MSRADVALSPARLQRAHEGAAFDAKGPARTLNRRTWF